MEEHYFYTDGLAAGYHGIPVVRNINIHVERGEIVTLVGPNGAGKSTILKTIAGELSPVSGACFLAGERMEEMDRRKLSRKVAVVFTEKLYGEFMTCEDVAAAGRYPYTGMFGILSRRDREAVREAMELVRASDLLKKEFGKISDGQRQRVMLARAICQEPELILLDEPTSYLDVKYKLEFFSVLQELARKRSLSVLMSIHELDLAERISDRVICVKDGRAERSGPPDEIFAPGYMEELFGITAGSFDTGSGTVELAKASGEPEVFVIAGNGTGRQVFRRLQREHTPFAAGILFENDLDYPTARALAARVVWAGAFEGASEETEQEAMTLIDRCDRVIVCRDSFSGQDAVNGRLLEYARRTGKIE